MTFSVKKGSLSSIKYKIFNEGTTRNTRIIIGIRVQITSTIVTIIVSEIIELVTKDTDSPDTNSIIIEIIAKE
jgi:hypothetical protein